MVINQTYCWCLPWLKWLQLGFSQMTQTTTSATSAPSCHGGLAPDQWEVPKEPPAPYVPTRLPKVPKKSPPSLWRRSMRLGDFLGQIFPNASFPCWIFIPLDIYTFAWKKIMGNVWKWNPSNFWLLNVFLKKTDLEMDWACNLSLFNMRSIHIYI